MLRLESQFQSGTERLRILYGLFWRLFVLLLFFALFDRDITAFFVSLRLHHH
jgi:hypothetical protein